MKHIGILRSVTEGDLELIRSWRNHPKIASSMYTQHEISAAEHREWWARTSESADQANFIYELNDEPLGFVGITQVDTINRSCFWAFYARPTAPKGTGSRMEFLALEHVFGRLHLHKLSCEVFAFNEPVIRLHKKFGFQVEGRFRDHKCIGDVHIDVIRLGMLDWEWSATRGNMKEMLVGNIKEGEG